MEFESFLREKYFEYREEVALYKEPVMTFEEYVGKYSHWLKDMYYGQEGKEPKSGGEV